MNKKVFIPLEKIVKNPYQINVVDQDKVLEIVASILDNRDNDDKGLLQVPTARLTEEGIYQLAFGHHRFYAFDYLTNIKGDLFFSEMPLIVRDLSDIEMFELMGVENFHRRDISPIEEANIFNTYMTQFNKTSVETAQKFEKTEEYVRGSIRLLNLPMPAQKLVEEGKLNKSAARDLLVLEKLGGAELVKDALEEIERDRFSNPTDSMEDVIRSSSEVRFIEVSSGWAAAKKFPVKHLAPITQGVLADLLVFVEGWTEAPANTIYEIMKLIHSGMEVTDEAFPQVTPESLEKVRILANPPQCIQCPLHAALDGSHYCGFSLCRERKQAAWKKHEVESISKKLGIPFYQKSDGESVDLYYYNDTHKQLFKSGSVDLRLMPARNMWNNFDGVGQELKVVVIGKSAEKMKKADSTVSVKGEKESVSRELQRQIYELRDQIVSRFEWEVVSRAFAPVLDGITSLEYLKFHFNDAMDNHTGDFPSGLDEDDLVKEALKGKKADALKEMRRLIMFHTVDYRLPTGDIYNAKKILVKMASECQKIAEEWGVRLPKDFDQQAEKYQAEFDAALKELGKKA